MNPEYNNLPRDFAHPGGFVESAMNYINDTAVCPQPMFSLAAALSLAGILYGRRVQSEDGLSTNIFVECVGYTSSGKDHGLKSIARILDSCAATNLRLGQVTSDSAIEWALKRQPRQIALIDEAGYFFSGVSDPNSKGSPAHSIKPALLELWSCANSTWVGKARVPRDGKTAQDPVVIERPHLCIYGTSQPQILFESVTKSDLRDGWLARNLWFISVSRPLPDVKPLVPVPNSIRAEVFGYKDEAEAGSEIVTVPMDAQAQAVFVDFGKRVYQKMLTADKSGDETNYLYGKAGENARRIALILAVSRASERGNSPLSAVIEERDAVYATKLVDYLIYEVIKWVQESLSENTDEKAKKRILKLLAVAGEAGLSRNELTRKTQFIRRSLRDEYLQDLIDGGQVVLIPFSVGHAHGEKLMLAEYAHQG